jgi:glutamine---fructose-6-phosphate transaminase (isomerizing)
MSGDSNPDRATRLLGDVLREPENLSACLHELTGPRRTDLRRAAALIRQPGRTLVIGIGSSWNAAIAVNAAFERAGAVATACDASELLHFGAIPECAAAVVLSRSGRSVEVVRLLEELRLKRCRIVAVTNTADSPLGREADAIVRLEAPFDHAVSVLMYSGLVLAGCLAAAELQGALSENLTSALAEALEIMAGSLEGWREQVDRSDWFDGDAPAYFLARGPSLATAHEARLLWEEAAKAPASALSTGGFRHGSQETVWPGLRVGIWLDALRMRDADLQLARDLRAAGARVLLVGQDLPAGYGDLGFDLPPVPAGWQPLIDVLPAQLAAERLARVRGQDPDSFRYCPYIIEREGGLESGAVEQRETAAHIERRRARRSK